MRVSLAGQDSYLRLFDLVKYSVSCTGGHLGERAVSRDLNSRLIKALLSSLLRNVAMRTKP